MGMFSQNEILLMIVVVSVLLFVITILTIFDIKDYLSKKKRQNNDIDFESLNTTEEIKEEISQEAVEVLEVNNDEVLISDIKEEAFIEEDEEPIPMLIERKEDPLILEEEKVELVKKDNKKRIKEELNNALLTVPNCEDAATKFEEEQERTAIISLDELLKNSEEIYSQNELTQYDDGNEPISIDEVMNRFVEEKEIPELMQDIVSSKEVYTNKNTIPFISSIYGMDKQDNSLEFENTATYEKLSREKNNEFMNKLREINENKVNGGM